jgi:hypothetical protein
VGLFRSANPNDDVPNWRTLFFSTDRGTRAPNGPDFPKSFDFPYSAMAVDPSDWNHMYLGGYSWVYRVWINQQPNEQITTSWLDRSSGATADHRSLTFLDDTVLLATGDQGIFGLQAKQDSSQWVSLNASLCVTEFFSVAYDPTTGFVCGGAQDVGTAVQNNAGNWDLLPEGDGDGAIALVGSDGVYYYTANDF